MSVVVLHTFRGLKRLQKCVLLQGVDSDKPASECVAGGVRLLPRSASAVKIDITVPLKFGPFRTD